MTVSGDLVSAVREVSRRLLAEGAVEAILGFENGTLPMRATPVFVTDPDATDRLIWNAFCSNNLSRYIRGSGRRLGIVAKGCDTRAIVELVKERQVERDRLVILGVPCRGMVDPAAILERCSHPVSAVEDRGDLLEVRTGSRSLELARDEVLHRSCSACVRRNPVISDITMGEAVPEIQHDAFEDVAGFASLPPAERRAHMDGEMSRCIRCYACRSACPLCYCSRCFVDDPSPGWVGRGTGREEVLSFHLMRAFHLAGRCVECGACERACPTGVDLRTLNRRTAADVAELFGYRAGLDPSRPAPLSTFDPDDPQDFILDPGECR